MDRAADMTASASNRCLRLTVYVACFTFNCSCW